MDESYWDVESQKKLVRGTFLLMATVDSSTPIG